MRKKTPVFLFHIYDVRDNYSEKNSEITDLRNGLDKYVK